MLWIERASPGGSTGFRTKDLLLLQRARAENVARQAVPKLLSGQSGTIHQRHGCHQQSAAGHRIAALPCVVASCTQLMTTTVCFGRHLTPWIMK
jgi:hypothetical protein